MRWLWVVALMALPAAGGQIAFESVPRLTEPLYIVVTGVAETAGEVTLVNLRTEELVRVGLAPGADGLRAGPIHARRACDPAVSPSLTVELGDTLIAATELGGGLAATARVGPRSQRDGELTFSLERWDDIGMKWVSAAELMPARFRIVLSSASADATCAADVVSLPVEVAGKAFELALVEDGAVSARFAGEFVVVIEPANCDLLIRVLSLGGDMLLEGPALGARLTCRLDGQTLTAPLPALPITLVRSHAELPVGCVGEVRVSGLAAGGAVVWCLGGIPLPVGGPVLSLYADAPRSIEVVALVRQGLNWGRAAATMTYVPQAKMSFVDAATGHPVTGPWPCTQPVRVKLENVTAAAARVTVGRLGADPRAQVLVLERSPDGALLSRSFRPAEFGACVGDVLWAQYTEEGPCNAVHAILPLQ